MADVLLFNQYFTSKREAPDTIFAAPPINLLCLASYLKEKQVNCKIYELGAFDSSGIRIENNRLRCGLSDKEIVEILVNESPKIAGIGCVYSRHYIDILSLARLIKSVNSLTKVVVGGNHASAFWNMVLKEPAVDFVVRGEGEITFYELCNSVLSGKSTFENIKGLAYKDKFGAVVKTFDRELIPNLDDLPLLDYNLAPFRKYIYSGHKSPFIMRNPAVGIISSRGCPGKCVYCTIKAVWGKSWRGKSVKKTVDEIELLVRKYGIREIFFLDDSVSLDKKRWEGICDDIIERKLNIRWTTPNGIAHWTLDAPLLKKMKKAGCYRITFGIESGNTETRKFLGKPYSLTQAKEMIQYANRIGMWTISTNILGFPYEDRKSMDDTLEFAQKSGVDFAAFFLLAPHVTSDVYSYFNQEGLLDFDFAFRDTTFDEEKYEAMNKMLNDGGIPTKFFSAEELKQLQIKYYKSFIIRRAISYIVNPLNILRKIRSLEDFRYTFRLAFAGLKILLNSFYKKTTKELLYE